MPVRQEDFESVWKGPGCWRLADANFEVINSKRPIHPDAVSWSMAEGSKLELLMLETLTLGPLYGRTWSPEDWRPFQVINIALQHR